MNTSSSAADSAPSDGIENRDEVASKWVVRLFLILAFGLAFGIEGMTLVRSYLLEEDEEAQEQVEREPERDEEAPLLRVGDDVLPATTVTERVAEMKIRGRSDRPWVFRLVVTVINDGDSEYRLSLRELEADDGTVFDETYAVEAPPGDSTRLVASWPVGKNARPQSLIAEAELQVSEDSTRSARRRVTFGHVPVQMER
jgi:hypothetical protein